uniref:Putative secreted protein n=1 Tax=Ixodes ricinus TaxID=34613 RepID=A0A6B0UJ11_IXORI
MGHHCDAVGVAHVGLQVRVLLVVQGLVQLPAAVRGVRPHDGRHVLRCSRRERHAERQQQRDPHRRAHRFDSRPTKTSARLRQTGWLPTPRCRKRCCRRRVFSPHATQGQ